MGNKEGEKQYRFIVSAILWTLTPVPSESETLTAPSGCMQGVSDLPNHTPSPTPTP